MAITKVSQLVRLSNSPIVKALTGRTFNDFGLNLNNTDILEVSYKKTGNNGYYSVGAAIDDLQYNIAGKYSINAANSNDNSILKPLMTYNPKYASQYKEADLLFYQSNKAGLTLIKRTGYNSNSIPPVPTNTNIAKYGENENIISAYWQYASLPWDSWIAPLFTIVQSVGKIQEGYWQEINPTSVFEAITFTAAYNELTSNYNDVSNTETVNLRELLKSGPLSSLTPNTNSVKTITGVSGVYNEQTDRYILKIDGRNKTLNNIIDILSTLGSILSSTNNVINPFFTFTINANENSNIANAITVNRLSVPYYTPKTNDKNKTNHTYCCLGNVVNDTTTFNISPVWAYNMVRNKENKLSSNTLNIISANTIDSATATTQINLNVLNPLYIENKTVKLKYGSGLILSSNNALTFDKNLLNPLSAAIDTSVETLNNRIDLLENSVSEISTDLYRKYDDINNLIISASNILQNILYGPVPN